MKIRSAEFVKSSAKFQDCPEANMHEYAFIGRSNVGKSSLINMLVERKSLAKTSSTPGKTQLINHFNIDDKWYLVDLPGYGYAKVSKDIRKTFQAMIRNYIMKRENLISLFVLLDARHEPQKPDIEFMNMLGENGVPFVMVFTKSDKLSSSQLNKNLKTYKQKMLNMWEDLPQIIVTSSISRLGADELLALIDNYNKTVDVNWRKE